MCNLRGTHISDQIYDGRYFDPSTRAAINAVWQLAEPASGTVKRHGHDGDMGSAMTCHDLSMKNNENLLNNGNLNEFHPHQDIPNGEA